MDTHITNNHKRYVAYVCMRMSVTNCVLCVQCAVCTNYYMNQSVYCYYNSFVIVSHQFSG